LDGARAYNAAIALNVDIKEITQYFDSVSICLSKGLGAPIGSLLLGNRELIKQARRWRKVLGGGMRQAGVIAAAAKIALTQNVEQLQKDHDNALYFAEELNKINGFKTNIDQVNTNVLFVSLGSNIDILLLANKLKNKGILISPGNPLRLLTHLDINKADIDIVIKEINIALN